MTLETFMLSVTDKTFVLSVIMLSVVMLTVVMLNVVAPFQHQRFQNFKKFRQKKFCSKFCRQLIGATVGQAPRLLVKKTFGR